MPSSRLYGTSYTLAREIAREVSRDVERSVAPRSTLHARARAQKRVCAQWTRAVMGAKTMT